jgi:hypothetical protein
VLQAIYTQKYPWLKITNTDRDHEHEHAIGACVCCEVHNKKNAWAQGAVVYDMKSLSQHARSKGHQEVVAAAEMKTSLEQAAATACDRSMRATAGLVPLFLTVVGWLMVVGRPLCSFHPVLVLLSVTGGAVLERKFNHSRYVWRALFSLSEAIMAVLLVQPVASPVFSLLFDLSSDVGSEEHMLLYIRCIDPHTLRVVCKYLCCVRVMGKTLRCWPKQSW